MAVKYAPAQAALSRAVSHICGHIMYCLACRASANICVTSGRSRWTLASERGILCG